MKIEWASHFRSDGTRRRPPPSAMHGWLAKIRGTLIGDEILRARGMREMKEAKARKRYVARLRQQRSANSGRSLLSFLGFAKRKKSHAPTVISKRRTISPHPTHRSRESHQTTRSRTRSPATSPGRSSPRRRGTDSSYRMPGHYDLSRPRQNARRSTT